MIFVPVRRPQANTALPRALSQLLDSSLAPWQEHTEGPATEAPAIDVAETATGYTVWLDVPGVKKSEVSIDIEGRQVRVKTAARDTATAAQAPADNEATPAIRWLHRERTPAAFERRFSLPRPLDAQASSAQMDNGVLTLHLVRQEPQGVGSIVVS